MPNSRQHRGRPRLLAEHLFVLDEQGQPTALLGTRCTCCGRIDFPGGLVCPSCGLAGHLSGHVMSGAGRLHALTVARVPSSLGHPAPRAYGYVDLPEDGTRIFAPLSGAPVGAFATGMDVRVVFGEIPATDLPGVWGYSFEPDEGALHGIGTA